ncbi:tyrosine-protein phosphatase [Oceanobacillus salinisoli]|uniref:tyrosine-protein phosphatase n=1 Tax=Oceanobacillus salinisoli TaxID=2678611 RepID=UPI0012E20A33|nr:tyrosine-protein phosphatase [Oceanobacillus salinisoli]
MKNPKLNWVRLPIKSLENCRELGGYNTEYGQQTRWHSFLRSSDMSQLEEGDISFLEAYGVKTVIDLRREEEIARAKNPLAERETFDYNNVPFMTKSIFDITKYNEDHSDFTMGDFYIDLLGQKQAVKKIFETIYHAEDGCILFHCRVGKDRTGVLAMLLLGLAGVERKDIVANYEVSYTKLESLHDVESTLPVNFLYSHRDYILKAYDYIIQTFGTFDKYLIAIGLTEDMLDAIKVRLIDDYHRQHELKEHLAKS